MLDIGFNFSKGGGTDLQGSRYLMELQSSLWRDNTKYLNEEGWKQMRQGLINADYNPLLAIGSSPATGSMPSAVATEGTNSVGFNMSPSANMQANTARKISDSQIMVNKATANKTAEEALTQQNVRNNLDSQALLHLLQSEEIQRLLPYKEQKMLADIAVADSIVNLNGVNAAYVPYNAETARISSNAAYKNAETNATWTPAKIVGSAIAGGLGAFGLGKFKPFLKGAKVSGKATKLGKSGFSSSSAKYFTTLH